ncbi:hypothetical protein BAZOLSSOX_2327 [uncultured Gammaproteobacteria bacterium]|jgi:hypothetical protein|nr:hypothetical protein [uncultured Gammaproteobacteria bacterium]VVH55930.1 hypothetical protein BAZOLSSOX_2327 [uncultured Gammaproteobacteria bacterium]
MIKFLFPLLFSFSVLALKPHTATYTLSTLDFDLAKVRITLSKIDNVYSYTLDAQTEGMIALFLDYKIRTKSVFVINQFGLQTKHYQNFEQGGEKVKKNIDIYPKSQQVDPLNQTLAIVNILEKNPTKKDFYFLVNDGKKISKKHYYQTQNSNNNLIKFVSSNGDSEVYFAIDKYYLPVLIRHKKFTYRLNSIQF